MQPTAMTYNQNGDNYNGGTTIESFHQPDLLAANELLMYLFSPSNLIIIL